MKKIFILLLAFSFLFSLGNREDREVFEIYEIKFNDEIRGTKKWSKLDGKWSSVNASIPKMRGYKIKGYDNYLILEFERERIYDLFILDMSQISSSIFPLKENKIKTIVMPYIHHSYYYSTISLKEAESIVNSLFSKTDELPNADDALYIDYYSYQEKDSKLVQYALRSSHSSLGTTFNFIYTAGKLSSGSVSKENLIEMFSNSYYETSYQSFYQFLYDFVNPFLKTSNISFEEIEQTEIIIIEIPETQIEQQQFKSVRPSIPIETDAESDIDTLDFMDTDIEGFGDWGAPPLPSKKENSRPKWVQYDQAPTPKKQLKPKYLNICRQAGIEGTVVLSFWVDETGAVVQESIKVLQSVPCLDQVCIDEVKKSKWKPARRGKEKVGVPISMPFNFKLSTK